MVAIVSASLVEASLIACTRSRSVELCCVFMGVSSLRISIASSSKDEEKEEFMAKAQLSHE
jgi:hypothetical protein